MAGNNANVQAVFDNAVATARGFATSASSQIAGISGTLSGLTFPSPVSVPGVSVPSVGAPSVTAVATPTYTVPNTALIADTFTADYAAKLADAQTAITGQLTSFFSTYFPMTLVDNELTLAQGWVIRVLSSGGAMDPAIENAYWQRDRDRIARDTAVAIDAASANWAARGFALPPGALVGAALQAARTGLEQASQSSREVAIKKYETEVMLQQKAIELAISLRQTAMSAMVDFIRTLVFAPRDNAQAFSNLSVQATRSANDALVSYFTGTTNANINLIDAQTRVGLGNAANALKAGEIGVDAAVRSADLALKSALGTTDIAVRQNETFGNWSVSIAGKRVDAALAAAHMAATMSSAALNGIHATVSTSASDSQNLQLYG